jgi:AcrR family transcriptional regulator
MMARAGRRPGEAVTRQAIIEAASAAFQDEGYTATTIRGIARKAEVDPALVYHYFGDKVALYVATLNLPRDPREVKNESNRGGFTGTKLVERFLAQWEPGPRFVALAQAMCSSPEAAQSMREFLADRVWEGDERGHALVASQLVGIAWARYILRIEPVASASVKQVAAMVGPTIDRYLIAE